MGQWLTAIFLPDIGADYNWLSVSAGFAHTIAMRTDGSLWAWGWNNWGQVGNDTNIDRYVPTRIRADINWALVSAGNGHSMAICSNGTLWAWGNNYDGQLGDGTQVNRSTPVQILP